MYVFDQLCRYANLCRLYTSAKTPHLLIRLTLLKGYHRLVFPIYIILYGI